MLDFAVFPLFWENLDCYQPMKTMVKLLILSHVEVAKVLKYKMAALRGRTWTICFSPGKPTDNCPTV